MIYNKQVHKSYRCNNDEQTIRDFPHTDIQRQKIPSIFPARILHYSRCVF